MLEKSTASYGNMAPESKNVLLTLAYALSGYMIGWPIPILSLASSFLDLH